MFDALRMTSWTPSPIQGEAKKNPTTAKRYAAAKLTRYVDFFNSLLVAHRERLRDLPKLRAHSRELRNDNAYASRYIELVSTNLVGPDGINFESEIAGNKGKLKEDWNLAIEDAWASWGKACTVDGRLGWVEVQQLIADTVATDGEILIRKVKGYPNACGFALELIDADRLDHEYSEVLKNGNRVIGGVEVDRWGRRIAYHLWTAHPDDYEVRPARTRVPADQILHIYREDRTQGIRGIPWMTPCMVQLNMLGRLWTAELAAANADADRLGIIKAANGLDSAELSSLDNGATAAELTSDHAMFMALDAGQDVMFAPPMHPNSVLPPFSSYLLKGIASGFGVAYHSLSGDLSESKFSSDRTALIQERDHWRKLQSWFIHSVCDPIFEAWIEMAYLSGALQINAPLDKLKVPRWQARTWDWVDPKNDIEASKTAIQEGLSTYQKELSAQGLDWRDVFDQRATEQAYAKKIGLVLGEPKPQQPKEDPRAGSQTPDPAA